MKSFNLKNIGNYVQKIELLLSVCKTYFKYFTKFAAKWVGENYNREWVNRKLKFCITYKDHHLGFALYVPSNTSLLMLLSHRFISIFVVGMPVPPVGQRHHQELGSASAWWKKMPSGPTSPATTRTRGWPSSTRSSWTCSKGRESGS